MAHCNHLMRREVEGESSHMNFPCILKRNRTKHTHMDSSGRRWNNGEKGIYRLYPQGPETVPDEEIVVKWEDAVMSDAD